MLGFSDNLLKSVIVIFLSSSIGPTRRETNFSSVGSWGNVGFWMGLLIDGACIDLTDSVDFWISGLTANPSGIITF